jgi:hypothetical protein
MKHKSLKITASIAAIVLWAVSPALAHPHTAQNASHHQEIANGQLHSAFVLNGETGLYDSCGGDPAAYGLETAHHGPDAGTPGSADGCYSATTGPRPVDDSPGID